MLDMEEESLKNFTNSVIFLVKLFAGLKDKFLAQKLYDKTSGFIAGYIKLFKSKSDNELVSHNNRFTTSDEIIKRHNIMQHDTMSHNIVFLELKNAIEGLLELLDYLEHYKTVSTTPLLYARRNLLDFKLNLVRLHHQPVHSAPKPKENKPVTPVVKSFQPRNLKESSNKERIFNFIKRSPNSRTKEIISEFSILSERTVKRNLKELASEGLVRKFAKDKGVYYSVVQQ